MKKALYYMAVLIGGYLVLVHYIGAEGDANAASTGGVNLVRALQGR